jgi:hypothetical protein
MSKRTTTTETTDSPDFDPTTVFAPSEGYTEVSSSDRAEGWFLLQAGNAVQGFLRGVFEVKDRFNKGQMKKVYRIEVTSDDPARRGPTLITPADSAIAEDWPEGKPAGIGDLIAIDEKGFLQPLRKIEEGREVWIACFGKDAASEEYPQGAWKFRVLAKSVTEPVTAPADDDDIPL